MTKQFLSAISPMVVLAMSQTAAAHDSVVPHTHPHTEATSWGPVAVALLLTFMIAAIAFLLAIVSRHRAERRTASANK